MKRLLLIFPFLLLGLVISPAIARAAGSTQLVSAMNAMPAQADKFRSMMSNLNASQFHVVNAGDVSGSDAAALKSSMKKNGSQIADLRETLLHTTVTGTDGVIVPLRKVLAAKNVAIDQIIGVYVGGDGQITLFYQ